MVKKIKNLLKKGKKEKDSNLGKDLDKKSQDSEGFVGFIRTLFFAGLLAVTIRSFLYEPFHIPSSSMKPGLLIGDYIFVSKMSYGYSKYSFPFSGFNLFDGRFFEKEPKRGDVVVFRLPSSPDINYIKRLVGLPGDVIKVTDGKLFINDQEIPKEYVKDFIDDNQIQIPEFEETFSEKKYLVLDQYQNLPQDNTGYYKVPEGHYFMMGDNRDNSEDSRFESQVGFIPKENLVGRATIIFFSTSNPIWKFWQLPFSIRFDRIFSKIN